MSAWIRDAQSGGHWSEGWGSHSPGATRKKSPRRSVRSSNGAQPAWHRNRRPYLATGVVGRDRQIPAFGVHGELEPITVALVNNMPDSAFVDTENQFRLASAAPTGARVELELYTITEIPRSEQIASVIQSRYRGLDELWSNPPDALIVTGTEPTQVRMVYEPYWPYMARLLEWAAGAVPTVLLSCLASHASVLLFDGIERVPLPQKCSGVFRGVVTDRHSPLARGLADEVPVPHSRVNEIPEDVLVDAGYRVVVGAARRRPAGPWRHASTATRCSCSARAIPSTERSACCASTAATCAATCSDGAHFLIRAFPRATCPP